MSFVALVGNPTEGYKVIGPFDSFDDAAKACPGADVWIMSLHKPKSTQDAQRQKKSDIVALLNRAAAALETPEDLSPRAVVELVEDLVGGANALTEDEP